MRKRKIEQEQKLAEQRVELHELRCRVADLEKDLERERAARGIVDDALNQLIKTQSDIKKLLDEN